LPRRVFPTLRGAPNSNIELKKTLDLPAVDTNQFLHTFFLTQARTKLRTSGKQMELDQIMAGHLFNILHCRNFSIFATLKNKISLRHQAGLLTRFIELETLRQRQLKNCKQN